MKLRARSLWIAIGVTAGCVQRLDLVVDAEGYLAGRDVALMVVDVVAGGELQHRAEIRPESGDSGVVMEDAFVRNVVHGVVAFADLNGDGACTFGEDHGWSFFIDPQASGELRWEVDAEVYRDGNACAWFSGSAPDWDGPDEGEGP